MTPIVRLEEALRSPRGDTALVAYLTGGFPDPETFIQALQEVAKVADAVEIGVPFSDPMADGLTIQRSSRVALTHGTSLRSILSQLESLDTPLAAPVLLMSYLNPLMAFGLDRLPAAARAAGVAAFIVPDLPLEESPQFRGALAAEGLGLVQMITPITPPDRTARLCTESRGFVYAVTVTGVTGGDARTAPDLGDYLSKARAGAPVPVLAGFGIRSAAQVQALSPYADGVIVGSALVECLESGRDCAAFLRGLRA